MPLILTSARLRSLLTGGLWSGILVAGASALPLLLAPVRANILGPESRGEFAFFQAVVVISASIAMGGLRYGAYAALTDGSSRLGLPILRASWPALLIAAVFIEACAAVSVFRLSAATSGLIAGLVLLLPGWVYFQVDISYAQLATKRKRLVAGLSVPAVSEFFFNLVAAVTHQLFLITSILITAFSEFLRGLMAARWRRADAGPMHARTIKVPGAPEDRFVHSSRRMLGAGFAPMASSQIDMLIYGAVLSPRIVGIYAVSKIAFSVFIPFGTALEGYAITVARSRGRRLAVLYVLAMALGMSVVVQLGVYLALTHLFSHSFFAAAYAAPVACLAGCLRVGITCDNAILAATAPNEESGLIKNAGLLLVAAGGGAVIVGALVETGWPSSDAAAQMLMAAALLLANLVTLLDLQRLGDRTRLWALSEASAVTVPVECSSRTVASRDVLSP